MPALESSDECLNQEIFYSLKEAQIVIEQWRNQYNTIRPAGRTVEIRCAFCDCKRYRTLPPPWAAMAPPIPKSPPVTSTCLQARRPA
jgi:Integrase core domain